MCRWDVGVDGNFREMMLMIMGKTISKSQVFD